MSATILKVGEIKDSQPTGWEFDLHGGIPALEVTDHGVFWAGYTVEELHDIAEKWNKEAQP